jgi:homoserine kinase
MKSAGGTTWRGPVTRGLGAATAAIIEGVAALPEGSASVTFDLAFILISFDE